MTDYVIASEATESTENATPSTASTELVEGFVHVYHQRLTEAGHQPTVGCVIPAYNEEDSIAAVIESILQQTVPPDELHVVVNNCTDDTFWVAREFAGEHQRAVKDRNYTTRVYIHDVGKLEDKKVGALNYGFAQVKHLDYLLGVDGDTVLDPRAVQYLVREISSDSRIGGVSAVYNIGFQGARFGMTSFLLSGQRAQFAAFNMLNLLRGRNMAVLGGQCSIFSVAALNAVCGAYRQGTPWVRDSEVEDSLLSLQIKRVGYTTKINPKARATVGGMTTMRALDAQQVKWGKGAIDLMWPGQRGNTTGQPFHPNLRLRWAENGSMLVNLLVRVMFIVLLAASLSIHAYVFSWWWVIPPIVAMLLNVRTALSMKERTIRDVLYAALFFPAEIYMWIRLGHFVRSWWGFFTRSDKDNWAAQARAEGGRGNAHLFPFVFAIVMTAAVAFCWWRLPLHVKEITLWLGWPVLVVLTVWQTLLMLRKLVRRHRGFVV